MNGRESLPADLSYFLPFKVPEISSRSRTPPLMRSQSSSPTPTGSPGLLPEPKLPPVSPSATTLTVGSSPPRGMVFLSLFALSGIPCLKISHKLRKRVTVRMDPAKFTISWQQVQLKAQKLLGSNKIHEFSVHGVRRVAGGADALLYREEHHLSAETEPRWLSISYYHRKKASFKQVHLVADLDHDFHRLFRGVLEMRRIHDEMSERFMVPDNGIECSVVGFYQGLTAAAAAKEHLSFSDIIKYASALSISLDQGRLRAAYDQVAHQPARGLTFDEFRLFVALLKQRPDIDHIYRTFSPEGPMTRIQFGKFLDSQGELFALDKAGRIFARYCVEGVFTPLLLNDYLLLRYLRPLALESNDHYFCYPLNEYYILSLHNTYLTGRQVAGDSLVEGYIKVLQRGCKCVEIDIWDPPNDSVEPVVNHGRTFTTPILFSNVLKACKQYGFATLPWPVILSFEVHCAVPYQLKVVELVREILGDQLVHEPITEDLAVLPLPMELKNKFLIKVKKGLEIAHRFDDESPSTTTTTTSFSEDSNGERRGLSLGLFSRRKKPKVKIDPTLGDLGIYVSGIKFTNFSLPELKTFNHCFLLLEKTINNMLKDTDKRYAIDKHNRKYFMRVYPGGMRVLLLNFIPINYWAHGAQMVATNWQTYDYGQQINELLFEGGSRAGYVLKPPLLRKPLMKGAPVVSPSVPVTYQLTMISAHHLPKPRDCDLLNPYVQIEVLDGDSTLDARTQTVVNNGFNPAWHQQFVFNITTTTPQLVFLRIQIFSHAESEVLLGQTMVNTAQLKYGYRYLALNDALGEELVYLLVFIKWDRPQEGS